jgi:hypothetical protein
MQFKDAVFESWKKSASDTVSPDVPAEETKPKKEQLYFGSK